MIADNKSKTSRKKTALSLCFVQIVKFRRILFAFIPSDFKWFYSLFIIFVSLAIFILGTYYGRNFESSISTSQKKEYLVKDYEFTGAKVLVTQPEDFYPVAEFRRTSALLLGCHNQIRLMPSLYAEIAAAVGGKVPIFGLVSNESQAKAGADIIRQRGLSADSMRFLIQPSDSIWVRDYAPFILKYDEETAMMVDAKYRTRLSREVRKLDEAWGIRLGRLLDLPVRSIPLVLEGGNFLSNGDGLLLTSSKTLAVNKGGKLGFNDDQLIGMFNDYLGVNGVFALKALEGEPNGHIDMFMTMTSRNTAIVGQIASSYDPTNSLILDKTAEFLSSIITSDGPIQVKRIPMPPRLGQTWRSYTNVIFANGILLMPSFSDVDPEIERVAEQVFKSNLPPGWVVKKINCDQLVKFNGQLHCMSYNIPQFLSIDSLIKSSYPRKQFL